MLAVVKAATSIVRGFPNSSAHRLNRNAALALTDHRMRPILLAGGVASLALIPIARESFWGLRAYAMTGGSSWVRL